MGSMRTNNNATSEEGNGDMDFVISSMMRQMTEIPQNMPGK